MKKLWMAGISAFVTCAFLTATYAAKCTWQPRETTVIVVPGESVGKIRIGMTSHEVHKLLGQPCGVENVNTRTMEKFEVWIGEKKGTSAQSPLRGFIVVHYLGDKSFQIAADLPRAATRDNFSMTSNLSAIKDKFKDMKDTFGRPFENGVTAVYSDRKQGIGFDFGMFDTSLTDYQFTPDEKWTPHYFMVVKRGRRAFSVTTALRIVHPHSSASP